MQYKIPILIHLEGKGVEDGSIPVEDLVPALQGFSSAYGKIASGYSQTLNHKIRVESFTKGSFDIHLLTTVMEHKDEIIETAKLIGITGAATTTIYKTVNYILQTIKAKKHIQDKPFTQRVNYNNTNSTVVIVNADNVELTVPLDVYNLIKEKTIDTDLNKFASIIDEENIDNISIAYTDDSEKVSENIASSDKKYFDIDNRVASETDYTWVTCKINTLTKSTNRGQAYTGDSTRVGFKIVAEHPEELYKYFAYKGWVKMYCKAKLDENLKPLELDVYKIEPIEIELPFDEPEP